MNTSQIIKQYSSEDFIKKALEVFRFQAENVSVYKNYLYNIHCDVEKIQCLEQIPFLPISFFKSHKIISKSEKEKIVFLSSGTTDINKSKHFIVSPELYEMSFESGFKLFFGNIEDYTILALLPSYLEQNQSSLVYMIDHMIQKTGKTDSGFYLHNHHELIDKLEKLANQNEKILLIGVSYALLDLLELKSFNLKNIIVMETGGMKGKRKEMIKTELHSRLKAGFGVKKIYSEYGMTELLSQAYSMGNEYFTPSPWMKIMIREVEDPFTFLPYGKTGGINVIDLANYYSCSFIETQDLGKTNSDGTFEVLGRFDHSDIRGCNLMIG